LSRKKLFIVLGMHRSGTSAICRALIALGVNLGTNLLEAMPGINPKGFWEDKDIQQFNENILSNLGLSWHDFMSFDETHNSKLLIDDPNLFDTARSMILSKVNASYQGLFGFKDPRLSKLLPFWKKIFAGESYDVSYVLSYRDPLSIAKSLEKRDGFESTKSYILWLLHVIPSLFETIGFERVLVKYDCLLEDPLRILLDISKRLNLILDEKLFQEYVTDFLDLDLRHTQHTIEDLYQESNCPELVRKVFLFLEDIREGKHHLDSRESISKIHDFVVELKNIQPILGLLNYNYTQNIDLRSA